MKLYGKNKPTCETVKREKEMYVSIASFLQLQIAMAMVNDKCLVLVENALNLYTNRKET